MNPTEPKPIPMQHHSESGEASVNNSKKLDRIMFLLEGSGEDTPGIVQTVSQLKEAMFGIQGRNGLTQKVDIMWRIYIWVLCSMSGVFGFALKAAFDAIVATHKP